MLADLVDHIIAIAPYRCEFAFKSCSRNNPDASRNAVSRSRECIDGFNQNDNSERRPCRRGPSPNDSVQWTRQTVLMKDTPPRGRPNSLMSPINVHFSGCRFGLPSE